MSIEHNHTTPTERTLPPLLRAQEYMRDKCYDCGRLATVYAPDDRTPLCGRCYLLRYEGMRAC